MTIKTKLGSIAVAASLALGAGSAAAETVTLKVASFPSFDLAVQSAIPLYKEINPNVEIELVSLAFMDHHNAMTTALSTGANLPDVMAIEVGFVGRFAQSGGLEDLRKAPYNSGEFEDKMIGFSVALGQSPDGGLMAFPADIGPGSMFYRKDIMDSAGVSADDLTRSWDSFLEAGAKVKEATGNYMVTNATAVAGILIRTGLKDGEGIYFDKDGNVTVNNDRFKEAFRLAKKTRELGIDAQVGAWSSEWTEGLRRGTIATEMMGGWLGGHLATWIAPESDGAWRASQLPGGSFASWGGSFYAIPSDSAKKAEAWEFIKFMALNEEMQIAAFRDLDAFPALVEAQEDDFVNQPVAYLGGQKARQIYKESADNIAGLAVHRNDPIAEQIINDALEAVLERDADIDEELAKAEKAIQRRTRR
ncbi:extracellular solute-binding protein [Aliagarivorans marinus]|uniref:extracellular solute-binding protein n=1 Tax=Aliagarivorans marinus TaxID=561965 RepID=UPI00040273E9|nr:extracellular solute-binding protein [Aliagarivorans marinus]